MFADFFPFWAQMSFSVIPKVFLTTRVLYSLKLEYLFEEETLHNYLPENQDAAIVCEFFDWCYEFKNGHW